MSCIQPLIFFQRASGKTITVPCNHCLNCLIRKQSQLEFLAKKELLEVYKKGLGASFVTFTYDDLHIPVNDEGLITLRKADLQKFMKNVRRQMEYHHCKIPYKYIACGEYGDKFARPHYHVVFLGLTDYLVKKFSSKCWKHGLIDIGPLSAGGLSYVCKYMSKSSPSADIKQFRIDNNVENPFLLHSIGLGKRWLLDNIDNIVESRFTFRLNGKQFLFPKYVLQYVKARTGIDYKQYVTDFITHSNDFSYSKANNFNYLDFSYEQSYLHYKHLVSALRSKNMPVNDITLSRCWVKPNHSKVYPQIKKLADLAYYGDVVPF